MTDGVEDTEPAWLSLAEQHAWFGVTAVMWSLPGALDAQLERDSGLNLFEYFVLSSLSMSPGRQRRMSEIAAQSSASPSRVSNVVARLEERGWVKRRRHESDGRSTVAVLTADGWDKVVAAAPGHVAEVRRLLIDGRTPEQLDALREVGVSVARRVLGERCVESLLPDLPED